MHPSSRRLPLFSAGIMTIATVVTLLLAGCGSTASAAAAQSTTGCPTPNPNAAGKTVIGKITALQASSATVATASGASVTVDFMATTQYSVLVAVNPSTLASGTTVQVIVAQGTVTGSVIPAQSVLVTTGQGGFGFGGGAGRGGAGRSFNPACRNRGTPTAAGFRGVRGTITAVNLGQNQFTVTDTQGASYVFSLSGSTVVATQSKGTQNSLAVGDAITARGQMTSAGLQAAIVQDLTPHSK